MREIISIMTNKILLSKIDKSINVIAPYLNSNIESRFVQRDDDYFIVYLSSQNGCNQSCRFCHLTQLGKTDMQDASFNEYIQQSLRVFDNIDYKNITDSNLIHYNFMSMGDPLLNETINNRSSDLFDNLSIITLFKTDRELRHKFNISTIIPKTFNGDLSNIFRHPDSRLYYSLYSVDSKFRKKWLPNAMDPLLH